MSAGVEAPEAHTQHCRLCVVGQRCILPCTFLPGGDTLIRWIQMSNNKCVHLYHDNKDQLESQIPSFQSRTSLFQDQISRGNASLLLMWVKVEDQGRYTCYTSTDIDNSENYVIVFFWTNSHRRCSFFFVFAALIRNVNIKQRIYPKPELSWSTNPPSPMRDPPKPEVQLMEDGLYNISSTIVKNSTALSYSCTVSAGRNKRKTTLWNYGNYLFIYNPHPRLTFHYLINPSPSADILIEVAV
uniref:Ig-like domain-containing protein n=1 Tax=Takifugu rubripes TaxID=31033 RepID=A0A3B5KUR8_TAKRU